MDFESPENLLDLINDVILYANQTPFYRPLLKNIIRITNIQDFKRIPITKLSDLRDAISSNFRRHKRNSYSL